MEDARETSGRDLAKIAVLGAPSSAGARRTGQEDAPAALRSAGLVARLEDLGFDVEDLGDLERVAYRPDPSSPGAENRTLVRQVAGRVATAVSEAADRGRFPVVLGGDCSITLGVVAGLIEREPRLGLVYFDGDLDLNTPATTLSGVFDGMVTAHLLGRGDPEVARIGPRYPLLGADDLLYFAYDPSSGAIDPPELAALDRSGSLHIPIDAVRDDPGRAAGRALSALGERVDRFLVHFDVDVTDLPAVDVAHPNGLPLAAAGEALEVFVSAPRSIALVVTELNAHLDADGAHARRLVKRIATALAPRAKGVRSIGGGRARAAR